MCDYNYYKQNFFELKSSALLNKNSFSWLKKIYYTNYYHV